MGTALQVYDKMADPLVAADKMAQSYAMVCGGKTKEEGFVIALTCMMEGITAIEFNRRYHMIQGKPSMRADALLAEFRSAGGSYKILENSPDRAAIAFTWEDETYEWEFTWEEAKQSRWPWKNWKKPEEGFKDNWSTPTDRRDMLWSRLVSSSVKKLVPEIAAGCYTPEELQDVADTPKSEVVVASESAPKKTALEVAKEKAAKVEPVVDAEYTIVSQTDVEEQSVPFDVPAKEEPKSAPANKKLTPSSTGSVTEEQIGRIVVLFGELEIDEDEQANALAARKCSSLNELSQNQAKDMIAKLEDLAKN
jgi:hypothetical protein